MALSLAKSMCWKCNKFKDAASEREQYNKSVGIDSMGKNDRSIEGDSHVSNTRGVGDSIGNTTNIDNSIGNSIDNSTNTINTNTHTNTNTLNHFYLFIKKPTLRSKCPHCSFQNAHYKKGSNLRILSTKDNVTKVVDLREMYTFINRCMEVESGILRRVIMGNGSKSLGSNSIGSNTTVGNTIDNNNTIDSNTPYPTTNTPTPPTPTCSPLFIVTLAIPPNKFRPTKKRDNFVFENPLNTSLNKILNLSELSENNKQYLQLLQEEVSFYYSSPNDSKSLIGHKQILEKKEGIFRQNIMGKRVNYSNNPSSQISPPQTLSQHNLKPYIY